MHLHSSHRNITQKMESSKSCTVLKLVNKMHNERTEILRGQKYNERNPGERVTMRKYVKHKPYNS